MVPWNHFSIHKTLLEEVEQIADAGQLKQIVKTLIRENLILSHRTNTVLKSLENQNTLIKYLQETLVSMMARNTMQADVLWGILGSETLRTFDDVVRYQMLIHDVAKNHSFGDSDKKILEELMNAALTVPYENVRIARAKCVTFLEKLKTRAPREDIEKEDVLEVNGTPEIEASSSRTQNGKIKATLNRKQQYKEILKKRREKINKRKSLATSGKHSLNKLQNSKSESSKKNYRKKNSLTSAKLANSKERDMEDLHSKKFSRRRTLKRKFEEDGESCLNLENNLVSVDQMPEKNLFCTNQMQSTSNSCNLMNETAKLKTAVIKLNDFMIDPSADSDQYVAQFKQAYAYKENEENEYEVVDEAGDDIDSDQRAESDHNSDNEEDRTSFKSNDSEDDQDSPLSKSSFCEDNNIDGLTKEEEIGKKGPCTPPLSPVPDDAHMFRRGPRTPSLSPPVSRRGPRTPPGVAPTSPSDFEGSNQEGSTLDIISEEATEVECQFFAQNADHVVLKDSN